MSNISKDSSKLWNRSFYKNEPSYISKENLNEPFNLSTIIIPKLKNPNNHYICTKCFYFPFIQFLDNKEDIIYTCACVKNERLKIKDLFDSENKYVINLNNNNIINSNDNVNLNKDLGFKCTRHKSNENKQFKYFCWTCNINICEDCLQYHLNNDHDLMNIEYQKVEMNKNIELINDFLNKEEEEEENKYEQSEESEKKDIINFAINDDDLKSMEDSNKTIKFTILSNGNYMKIPKENKKVIHNKFKELINIIINDYINYPNYYHFFNIWNIYNILFPDKIYEKEEINYPEYINEDGIVIFELFGGRKESIKCNIKEKIREICKNANIDIYSNNELIYNGNKINIDSSFEEIINEEDKKENIMKIKIGLKYNDEDRDNDKATIIKSKCVICPQCGESIFMNIKNYKINLFGCKNNHRINNLLFSEFKKAQNIDLKKIICNNCNKKTKDKTNNNKFFRCLTCGKNICPLCNARNKEKEDHIIVSYDEKDYICDKHKETYKYYCSLCKQNICDSCYLEHKNHNNNINKFIFYNKNEILNEIDELKKNIDNLNKIINEIIDKFHNFIYNINLYDEISRNIINNYDTNHLNYQIIQNINEILYFKKLFNKDIMTIINENDISKRVKYIIDLDYRMNNINEDYCNEIITHKFWKKPQNLKYKLNITERNDFMGANDLFEVFVCNKDHKEYVISKNIYNYNLDIYTLLDNKKLLSVQGHKNRISTIRYFINNINNDEYLISADINGIVILWDILNNYKIKYQINTLYNIVSDKGLLILSCLLIFDKNNEDNYIITSLNNISEDINNSGTKIYSLNNGNFIEYIDKSNKIKIFYLLSWFNKKKSQYYIIQFGKENIVINSLLKNELYSEFIQKPKGLYYSGFIYKKNDNEYLLSCSTNGYINIWDLYNKKIYKTINLNNCQLMSIIEWNDKYVLVSDFQNSIEILDIRKLKIVHKIKGEHTKNIKCIKKIYHPTYGESLLSSGKDYKIDLWTI